jgi:hypothetical protein
MLVVKLDSAKTVQLINNNNNKRPLESLNPKKKYDNNLISSFFGKNISADYDTYGYTDYEKPSYSKEKKKKDDNHRVPDCIRTKKQDQFSNYNRRFCIQLVPQSLHVALRNVVWPSHLSSVRRAHCTVQFYRIYIHLGTQQQMELSSEVTF